MANMNKIFDIIGIGFGPSNLSLCAFYESERKQLHTEELEIMFLEKYREFDWHPGMLIDGADMQISFLKDLITLKNPSSEYTFLNFLKETNGLEDFVNLRTFSPSRIEFRNYLRWAANKLNKYVTYNQHVIEIAETNLDGEQLLEITAVGDSSKVTKYFARNVIVSTGGSPKIPEYANNVRNVFHSSKFLPSLEKHFSDETKTYRFLVVGGGQSAAEIFQYIYNTYPNAQVSLAVRNIGFKPADDSEFVNELFNSSFVDEFYSAPQEFRESFLRKHNDTNYGVVDQDLIKAIYRIVYEEKRKQKSRINYMRFTEMISAAETNEGSVTVELSNCINENSQYEVYDAVFLATGYIFSNGLNLLSRMKDKFECDESGSPQFSRNYTIKTKPGFRPQIFVFGPTEISHGLTSVLLSVLPYRAESVFSSIVRNEISTIEINCIV